MGSGGDDSVGSGKISHSGIRGRQIIQVPRPCGSRVDDSYRCQGYIYMGSGETTQSGIKAILGQTTHTDVKAVWYQGRQLIQVSRYEAGNEARTENKSAVHTTCCLDRSHSSSN